MNGHRIAVVGLGYVGLPVAVAFGKIFKGTIGFDISAERVAELKSGKDRTEEVTPADLRACSVDFTTESETLSKANVFIICVPTPIYEDRRPDLTPLRSASETVGRILKRGDVVVYESTVYPGLTEDYCRKILAQTSGLVAGVDFWVGYSPERINPGDKAHTFEKIKKIVSAETDEVAHVLADIYGAVVEAGIHVAPSIKVAEAAKVIENTQRDLNIALMNELAIICDRLDIRTDQVIDAAATKWNFLKFLPGLVGGHCIGVDPYYLTTKAQELGYHPEVILAGRRINDSMGTFIAQRLVRMLSADSKPLRDMRVAIMGITFKEDIPDIRNSRVPDISKELRNFGINALLHDPHADAGNVSKEYGLNLSEWSDLTDCDALVLAVPHKFYLSEAKKILSLIRDGGVLMDVKSALKPHAVPAGVQYWSL